MKLTSCLTAFLATSVLAACPAPSSGPGPSEPVVVRDHRDEPPPPAPGPTGPVWDSSGWRLLGSQTVDGAHDRDVIAVGGETGRVDALTLVVLDSDLELKDLVVTFGNNTQFEPRTTHHFREGQRTRRIDLPTPTRVVKNIQITYGNLPGGGKARVEIYGHDVDGAGPGPVGGNNPPPPPPPPSEPAPPAFDPSGWTLLASGTVDGKKDLDVFPVGKKFGTFERITVVVQDSSLELTSFVVHFSDGSTFDPELRQVFNEGTRSRVIDLPGKKRNIRNIAVRYANLPGGGKARIEIYAKSSK